MRDAFGQPQTAICFGGTSEIATAILMRLANERLTDVVLVGRDAVGLEATADLLRTAGVTRTAIITADASDPASAGPAVKQAFAATNQPVDLILMAVGMLGDQTLDDDSAERTATMMTVNLTWPAAVLAQVRGRMVTQGMGKILVLSSVAAIRTRKANYTYGAGKMGLDGFALGLADSVRGTGVSVQIARPGFVTSRMTAHLKPIPFSTTPDVAAEKIVAGLSGEATVLWSPGILRVVFAIFRIVPPMLWRKMPA